FKIVLIHAIVVDGLVRIAVIGLDMEQAIADVRAAGFRFRTGRGEDMGVLADFVLESEDRAADVLVRIGDDGDHLRFVETQVFAAYIIELVVDHDSADQHHHGDGELGDDEDASEHHIARALGQVSFKDMNGVESGKIERWVAAAEKTHENDDRQQDAEGAGLQQSREGNGFAGEVVEGWQQERDQTDAQQETCDGGERRLEEELGDELRLCRTGDLTDADLFGAPRGSRRRQVHVVDAADDQQEEGHGRYNIDIGHAA